MNNPGYAELLKSVATAGDLPAALPSPSGRGAGSEGSLGDGQGDGGLLAMIARGLGVDAVPADRDAFYALLDSGHCVPALSFDLSFPEVFYPNGVPHARKGFDVVFSNPPWDRPEVKEEEYWCRFDLEVLDYTDKDARRPLIEQIAAASAAADSGWKLLNEAFEQDWRIQQELYRAQSATVDGRATTGRPDLYRLFAERGLCLLRSSGKLGWVLPSGFHANEGATGIRRLYLSSMNLHCCFSFENRKKLFEIDSRQKFAIIAATSGGPTDTFKCAFYLHNDEWLYGEHGDREKLRYTREYVERVGGQYLSFPECRTQREADLLGVIYGKGTKSLGGYLDEQALDFSFGVELHRNVNFNNPLTAPVFGDVWPLKVRLSPNDRIPVFRGKAFWQFSDRGEFPIDVVAPLSVVLTKDKWNPAIAYYRIVFRETASSTNERTLICAILWPGSICNHKAGVEVRPHRRTDCDALALLGILNSYFADWQVRQKAATNVNAFVFRATRLPVYRGRKQFISHAARRLTCNHRAYAPLWREQVGEAWREEGRPPMTWPVLAGDDERWAVRAAIDAVVADAYGLSRDQYAHVLSTFSHASYRQAPELCLARFDELKKLGLETFTRKYDPYWDIPLNENLPQPVIDLPIPGEAKEGDDGQFRLTGTAKPSRGKGKNKRS